MSWTDLTIDLDFVLESLACGACDFLKNKNSSKLSLSGTSASDPL